MTTAEIDSEDQAFLDQMFPKRKKGPLEEGVFVAPPVMTPREKFTQEQMSAAFDMVKNKQDWKMPIQRTIDNPGPRNLACLEEAIIHFTGSVADIMELPNGKFRVVAPGYYMMQAECENGFLGLELLG